MQVHGYSCVPLYSDMGVYCDVGQSGAQGEDDEQEQRKAAASRLHHLTYFHKRAVAPGLCVLLCWEWLPHGQSDSTHLRYYSI